MRVRWSEWRFRLGLVLAALVILVAAWSLWPRHRHEWHVHSFSLANEPLERQVFELELRSGDTLVYRLDPKPGAGATLLLHTPAEEVIAWDRAWQRTRDEAELTVVEPGVYRLMLVTEPTATAPGETTPEVEVLWRTD